MYGAQGYSEYAYSEQDYTPLDTSAFEAFLAEVTSKRCWLLELDALSLASVEAISSAFSDSAYAETGYGDASGASAGGVQTLRFSTHGYTSKSGDSPANTWYDGRVSSEIRVSRTIAGRDGIGGLARVFADISLLNADGGLDQLIANYALDGRSARILVGRADDALSAFGLVFTGVLERRPSFGLARVALALSDGAAKLDRAVNATTYAGSGGLEGGVDIKGKPKPKGWGKSLNISPPLVDSAKLIYQPNDGAVNDVPAVYDRGVALTKGSDYSSQSDMDANAPAAGQYRVWKAGGYFRLGATPAGTLTCDLEGDASGAGYVARAADIVLRILVDQAGLNSSEIDPASFANLNTDAPAEVGIWIDTEQRTIEEVVDELLAGVGAFGGFSRSGAFSVGLVAAPSGKTKATYTEEDILDIVREPLPAPVDPIVWRTRVGYQRNYTLQEDVAASVSDARRTFAAEAERFATKEDAAIKSRYLLATEFSPPEAVYAQESDAAAETGRRFDLWSKERAPYRVKLRPPALVRDLGQEVELQHRRLGLKYGKPGRVLGYSVDRSTVELLVLA